MALEFPQTDGRVLRAYVPFLSNPIITERGQSNLIEYDLVGRPGSMYSYGGAKSRVVNLNFKINLLHTLYTNSTEGIDPKFLRQFNLFFADKERAKKAFRLKPKGSFDNAQEFFGEAVASGRASIMQASINARDEFNELSAAAVKSGFFGKLPDLGAFANSEKSAAIQEAREEYLSRSKKLNTDEYILNKLRSDAQRDTEETSNRDPDLELGKGFEHAATHRNFYLSMLGISQQQIDADLQTPAVDEFANSILEGIGAETIPTPSDNQNDLNTLIDATFVWVNLVRATVLNRSDDTTKGPPIVRLQHGPMYNNVPFVVSDYNISIEDQGGYEVETLTPKILNISMTLKEFRTNGSFVAAEIESGDNICGWEAILGNNNIDPYNGDVGQNVFSLAQTSLGSSENSKFIPADTAEIGSNNNTGVVTVRTTPI